MSYAKIEQAAHLLRKVVGLDRDPLAPFPCAEMFEKLDEFTVRDVPLINAVGELEPTVEGKTRFCARTERIEVILAEETYGALQHDQARARFSVLHEIAHAVIHPREVMRLADALHPLAGLNRGQQHKAFEDTEWQADALAAAALMPARGLAELARTADLSPRIVAGQYGASHEAATIRIDCFNKRHGDLLAAIR